jgi:serine/threonine protein kinase
MEKYRIIREIDRGAYGEVLHAARYDGGEVAIKRLFRKELDSPSSTTQNEILILSKLHHEHVTRYLDAFTHDGRMCIVLKYEAGGSLKSALARARHTRLPHPVVARIVCEVAEALHYLHDGRTTIVHRDLK